MKRDVVVAIDLGGTKLAVAIFASSGKILHKEIVLIGNKTGRAVGKLIRGQIENCFSIAKSKRLNIRGIGVSVPGISHLTTGEVWAPNIPGWKNYPLRSEIIFHLKDKTLPVKIESDRACYILGEAWQGAARKCANAIFLAVGTGIGAGILVDGRVLRGVNDIAGAIGWFGLQRPFTGEYTACGCFEHHASGQGLVKIATQYMAADKNYSGVLRKKQTFTAADIFQAHQSGDPIAEKVLEQAIGFWGMAVANLVSLFNPGKIIFGGGIFGPATNLLPRIFAEAKKWAQPISIKQVKLEASKLGADAGLYGAGWLALKNE